VKDRAALIALRLRLLLLREPIPEVLHELPLVGQLDFELPNPRAEGVLRVLGGEKGGLGRLRVLALGSPNSLFGALPLDSGNAAGEVADGLCD
jgi:hypothetical protein